MRPSRSIIAIFIIGISIFSCSKKDTPICDKDLICTDEACLFTLKNTNGVTMYLSCFERWGIYAAAAGENNTDIWLIVDDWDSSYNLEGLSISFCGYVRENSVPLQFPDPNIGFVCEIDLVGIEKN